MEIPSMPKMPPPVDKTVLKENFCLIHKGDLTGEIYTCKCGAKMCLECAQERKESINRLCPKCSSVIFIKNQ